MIYNLIGYIEASIAQVVPKSCRKDTIVRHGRYGMCLMGHTTNTPHSTHSHAHTATTQAKAKSQKVKSVSLLESRSIFYSYIFPFHSFCLSKVKSLFGKKDKEIILSQKIKNKNHERKVIFWQE